MAAGTMSYFDGQDRKLSRYKLHATKFIVVLIANPTAFALGDSKVIWFNGPSLVSQGPVAI